MHENDNLRKDYDKLQQRLRAVQENSNTLSLTLNET